MGPGVVRELIEEVQCPSQRCGKGCFEMCMPESNAAVEGTVEIYSSNHLDPWAEMRLYATSLIHATWRRTWWLFIGCAI
jgi:hypothetical protein